MHLAAAAQLATASTVHALTGLIRLTNAIPSNLIRAKHFSKKTPKRCPIAKAAYQK